MKVGDRVKIVGENVGGFRNAIGVIKGDREDDAYDFQVHLEEHSLRNDEEDTYGFNKDELELIK